jgi:hypothetical protein
VKFYNRRIEEFEHTFEETLGFIAHFQAIVCDSVYGTYRDRMATREPSSKLRSSMIGMPERAIPPPIPLSELTISDGLSNDVEMGLLLRKALAVHATVNLLIPRGTRLRWERTVQLKPHQSLSIVGDSKVVIQMKGSESLGGYVDPSRLLLDAFSTFHLRKVRIEAACGPELPSPEVDFHGLFVVRGWDAMGPTIVAFQEVVVDSDRNIINVGGNGCAQIYFQTCKFMNSKGEPLVSPVSPISGSYPHGTASVVRTAVKLSGNGIAWGENQYVVKGKEDPE